MPGRVLVQLRWREDGESSARRELFQLLAFRKGRIVAMQDYRDRKRAFKALASKSPLRTAG